MATIRTAGRPNGGRVPEYRMYFVEVARKERLGPSFVRVTFTGECLRALCDRQYWDLPNHVEVRWLVRRHAAGSAPHGSLLEAAVGEVLAELCGPNPPAAGADLEDVDVDTSILWDVPDGSTCKPDAPRGELYAWLAGEAGVIKRLRRLVVNDHGVPRTAVAFMGYWRQGRSG